MVLVVSDRGLGFVVVCGLPAFICDVLASVVSLHLLWFLPGGCEAVWVISCMTMNI